MKAVIWATVGFLLVSGGTANADKINLICDGKYSDYDRGFERNIAGNQFEVGIAGRYVDANPSDRANVRDYEIVDITNHDIVFYAPYKADEKTVIGRIDGYIDRFTGSLTILGKIGDKLSYRLDYRCRTAVQQF
ncbi:hypothetical protein AB4097_19325 [Microvirga sp. 2MCAF35]|uniref:hypothetical protein n=1 Tax=Microvirga sp. 2MCAF35 TaxID=3232987 RepID=UPI003F96448C